MSYLPGNDGADRRGRGQAEHAIGCRVEHLNISPDSPGNVFRSWLAVRAPDEPCDAADRAMQIVRRFDESGDVLLARL
jgi:hypothetical protein